MGSFCKWVISGRLWRALLGRGAIALTVVLVVVLVAPSLSFIEVRSLDVLYMLRPSREPDPRIAIVDVGDDPGEYEHLRDPRDSVTEGCKIPRLAYAEAVRRLSHWGAKVIVFDLMFGRRCPHEDKRLAQAFQQAGNVVVAATTKTKPGAVGLEDPIAPLDIAVWGVGSPVAHQPNEAIRSIPLLVQDRDSGRQYLALSLVAFQRFREAQPAEAKLTGTGWLITAGERVPVLSGERIRLLGRGRESKASHSNTGGSAVIGVVRGRNVSEIPKLTTWNTMLLNWVGPAGTIRPYRLSELLAISDDEQGRALFGGKAVIIGQADWDAHWTAMGSMPGLEVQANALNTLMSGRFIRPLSPWGMIVVLVVFALATTLTVRQFKGVRALGAVLLLMAVAVALAQQLLAQRGIWMYLSYCELGIGLTWATTTAAESGKVTKLLTRFVPSFIGRPETPGLSEVRSMEASILFSDIRGYTSIAEQLSAVDTLKMLNAYQITVEDIVTRHGGTIVKTPGDAVLAVFWKEVNGHNHAVCALRCAQEMLDDLPIVGRVWKAAGVNLDIGIGIDAGPVAMGLVGKHHLEPTVIGDPVNVAQRLESLTKVQKRALIFSESVQERLGQEIEVERLDQVTVKGRTMPLTVYGVTASRNPMTEPEHQQHADYKGEENATSGIRRETS